MSKNLLNAIWELGIPVRKLQLIGKGGWHTMVELHDISKCRVFSPSDSSFIWVRSNRNIVPTDDIKSNTLIISQVNHNWKSN